MPVVHPPARSVSSQPRPARVVWRAGRQGAYVAALQQRCPVLLQRMTTLLQAGDADGAVDCLVECIQHSASSAGMTKESSRTRPVKLPYVTPELVQLRRDCWRAFRHGDRQAYHHLRTQYQHAMRFRKRMWLRHRCRHVAMQLKHDSHTVCKAYRGPHSSLPELLQHPADWQPFLQSLASPDVSLPQPPVPRPVSAELLCYVWDTETLVGSRLANL